MIKPSPSATLLHGREPPTSLTLHFRGPSPGRPTAFPEIRPDGHIPLRRPHEVRTHEPDSPRGTVRVSRQGVAGNRGGDTAGNAAGTKVGNAAGSAIGSRVLCGALGVAGMLLVLEVAGRTGLIDPEILPLTSTILTRVAELAVDGEFLANVEATMTAWGLGLLLTVAVTVPLGLLLGSLPRLETAVRPLIEFLRPIPSVALIPLAILIFPDRLDLKIAVIFYASCWPVLINTMYGLQDVDPVAKETLRSFGFGPLAVLWRVSLPSTAPFIATGVRLAGGIALILAISAELIAGGSDGIGAYVIKAGSSPEGLEFIIAATVWAGILGVVTNTLLIGAERRLFRWHTARAGVNG